MTIPVTRQSPTRGSGDHWHNAPWPRLTSAAPTEATCHFLVLASEMGGDIIIGISVHRDYAVTQGGTEWHPTVYLIALHGLNCQPQPVVLMWHRACMAGARRKSAKVLLVDPDGRVLLFSAVDPAQPDRPPIWFPVGGGVDQGETLEEAAIREVREETGLLISDLGPVVMTRQVDFEFEGHSYNQDETYFAVRTEAFVPDAAGWTETEQRVMVCSRWWSLDDLRATDETVYPERLSELIGQLQRA